jgi:hypothetical protein
MLGNTLLCDSSAQRLQVRIRGVRYTGLVACTVCLSDSAVQETRGAAAVTPNAHGLTLDCAHCTVLQLFSTTVLLDTAKRCSTMRSSPLVCYSRYSCCSGCLLLSCQ